MLKIIGVHSNVVGGKVLTDGHAWISMHFENGRSTSVGLWVEGDLLQSRRFIKDPIGFMSDSAEKFEINFGLEDQKGYKAAASRYYFLEETQAKQATRVLGEFSGWRFTNTCASWATEVVKRLTGEKLDSGEFAGLTNTPRALGAAIAAKEKVNPTSLSLPKRALGNPIKDATFSSSIFAKR